MTQAQRLPTRPRFVRNRFLFALGVSVSACLGAPDSSDVAPDDSPEDPPAADDGAGAHQADSTGGAFDPSPPRSEPLPKGSSCHGPPGAQGAGGYAPGDDPEDPDEPSAAGTGASAEPSSGGSTANARTPSVGGAGAGGAATGGSTSSGAGGASGGSGGDAENQGGMGGALGEAGAAGSPGPGGTSSNSGGSENAGGSHNACGGMGGTPAEPEAGAGGAGGAPEPPVPEASLWISEYMEGASSDKALEIYNAGPDAVQLQNCVVRWYANGASTPRTVTLVDAGLPPGEVFVVCHSKASPEVLSRCDHPTGALSFNGDDAVALACFGENVDVIGQIGVDPGSAWSGTRGQTADHVLRRACHVLSGDPFGDDVFDLDLEWRDRTSEYAGGLGDPACAED